MNFIHLDPHYFQHSSWGSAQQSICSHDGSTHIPNCCAETEPESTKLSLHRASSSLNLQTQTSPAQTLCFESQKGFKKKKKERFKKKSSCKHSPKSFHRPARSRHKLLWEAYSRGAAVTRAMFVGQVIKLEVISNTHSCCLGCLHFAKQSKACR